MPFWCHGKFGGRKKKEKIKEFSQTTVIYCAQATHIFRHRMGGSCKPRAAYGQRGGTCENVVFVGAFERRGKIAVVNECV